MNRQTTRCGIVWRQYLLHIDTTVIAVLRLVALTVCHLFLSDFLHLFPVDACPLLIQMLTVFLLPLLTAGLHLCFAFPMIRMLLLAFSMTNTMLFVQTCLISFAVFGLFYVIVYRITSNAYYSIVSGAKEEA